MESHSWSGALIKRSAFLPIARPRLVKEPPTGPDWLHEVKFDGFRLQAHKLGDKVRLFSENGKDFTDRFQSIAAAVLRLPATAAVIDGELVVCDGNDQPDFYGPLRSGDGWALRLGLRLAAPQRPGSAQPSSASFQVRHPANGEVRS